MDKPSVGRIVHYVAYGTPGGEFPAGVCRAAVITEVYRTSVDLPEGIVAEVGPDGYITNIGICVINPTGLFFHRGTSYDVRNTPGTWHWPERV